MGLAPIRLNPARALPMDSPVNTERSDYSGDFKMNLEIIGDPGQGRERLCRQLAENDLNDGESGRRVYYFTTSPVSNGLAALFDVVLIGSMGNFPIVGGEGEMLAEAAIAAQASAVIDLGGVDYEISARIVEGFLKRISRERETPMTIYFENGDATLRRKRNRDSNTMSAAKTALSTGFPAVGGADMRFVVCAVSSREIPLEIDALLFDVVATKLSKPSHIESLATLVNNRKLVQYQDVRALGLPFNHPDEYWIWAFTKGLAHLPKHFRLDDAITPAGRGEPFPKATQKNVVEDVFEQKLEEARAERDAKKDAEQPTARLRSGAGIGTTVRAFKGAGGAGPRLVGKPRPVRFDRIQGQRDPALTLTEMGGISNPTTVVTCARYAISFARKGRIDYTTLITHDEIIETIKRHPRIATSATWANNRNRNGNLVAHTILGHFRYRLGDSAKATAFTDQIASKADGSEVVMRLKVALAALVGKHDEASNLKRISMINDAWREFSKAANDDEALGNAA